VLLDLAHEVRAGAGADALGLLGVVLALDDDRRVDLGQLVREDGLDDDALDLLDSCCSWSFFSSWVLAMKFSVR
jgi:hypothetical protein